MRKRKRKKKKAINNRIKRSVKLARKLAAKGNSPNFRLGAVLLKGNKIISTGRNYFYKTHPKATNALRTIHAEVDCVRRIGRFEDPVNSTLVIVRETNSGLLSMAKPCPHCMDLLYQIGVKDIWYTNYNGNLEHMYL